MSSLRIVWGCHTLNCSRQVDNKKTQFSAIRLHDRAAVFYTAARFFSCFSNGVKIHPGFRSQIQIKGGGDGISYGIEFLNDGIYSFNTENWTGNMTVSGSSGAICYENETNVSIRNNSENTCLKGYTDAVPLDEETYKNESLQKYKKLVFEGFEN